MAACPEAFRRLPEGGGGAASHTWSAGGGGPNPPGTQYRAAGKQ